MKCNATCKAQSAKCTNEKQGAMPNQKRRNGNGNGSAGMICFGIIHLTKYITHYAGATKGGGIP